MSYRVIRGQKEVVHITDDREVAIGIAKQLAIEDYYREKWSVEEVTVIYESQIGQQEPPNYED